jgi:hypothetical protein
MRFYDIFNGDADGICALHQLRLAQPQEATLVTGVKRDTRLLARVEAARGDSLTVLDVSLDANRQDLERALAAGARCRYFDHHFAGEVPDHRLLEAHIDTSAGTCTSLIVDRHLGGAHRAWAVVAAFGDNLAEPARQAALPLALDGRELETLRELGECLNYNAYGETVEDLHIHPAELYRRLRPYADPLAFAATAPEFARLRAAVTEDLEKCQAVPLQPIGRNSAVAFLPDERWARRAMGTLANRLASEHPQQALAVLLRKDEGYTVSLRGPNPAGPGTAARGIDEIARQFPGGNGRAAAAGIPLLPASRVDELLVALRAAYGG